MADPAFRRAPRPGRSTRVPSPDEMNRPAETTVESIPARDAQAEAPATRVSLSRVGVTGVEKVIRVCLDDPNLEPNLFHATLECFVDLNPEQAGVHMSRFEEVVNEA